MAKPHTNTTIFPVLFLTLLLITSSSAAAAARLPLNLALPANNVVPQEDVPRRLLPCNTAITNRKAGTGFRALRLCANSGHLLLSMLPKGGVPPSGPSRRTNDNNN